MADQEEGRLQNSGEAVMVVDRQKSSESKNKPSGQDGPSDGPHKRPIVPGIPSVAEKVKQDLQEKSHVNSKPTDQYKVPKEIINQQAAKMQSKASHVPVTKPLETIELTKVGSGSAVPEVKPVATLILSTKKIDSNFEKRVETTFPAEKGSEPTVSEVPRRFESTVPKKKLEPVVTDGVDRSEHKGSDATESESTKKVKQSQPIPQEVKPPITKASLVSKKTTDERSDEDIIPDDIVAQSTRDETSISVWSDEQEAGGLPRTESISSRMSRAVRQLFCCGVAYSPPSEDDISTTRISSAI